MPINLKGNFTEVEVHLHQVLWMTVHQFFIATICNHTIIFHQLASTRMVSTFHVIQWMMDNLCIWLLCHILCFHQLLQVFKNETHALIVIYIHLFPPRISSIWLYSTTTTTTTTYNRSTWPIACRGTTNNRHTNATNPHCNYIALISR